MVRKLCVQGFDKIPPVILMGDAIVVGLEFNSSINPIKFILVVFICQKLTSALLES